MLPFAAHPKHEHLARSSDRRDIVDPVGRKRGMPRRVGRLIAKAKEKLNSAVDADDRYQIGEQRLINKLAEFAERNPGLLLQTDQDESEELHAN